MWKLNREYVIKEIKKIAKWNLKEMRYIFDMYCDNCILPDTHFLEDDLEALAEGRKRERTNGRFYTEKKLEEFRDKELYGLLIMIKEDEANIMKCKIDDLVD